MFKLAGSDSISLFPNPTSKQRDVETGWDYFGARYYNPVLGRWMAVDPIYDELEWEELDDYGLQSINPYNYVYNNPVSNTDPDGKLACAPFCTAVGAAIVGGVAEYGTQVVGNFISGKKGIEIFTDIDLGDVGVAAIEGAITQGASVGRRLAITVGAEAIRSTIDVKTSGVSVETNAGVIATNTAIGVGTHAPIPSKTLEKIIPNGRFDSGEAVRNARTAAGGNLTRPQREAVQTRTAQQRTRSNATRQAVRDGISNQPTGGLGAAAQSGNTNRNGRPVQVRHNGAGGRGRGRGYSRGSTSTNNSNNNRPRTGRGPSRRSN